jgi:hypothetical protein
MALLTQANILTTLAYLMGERSVNSTTSAPRADFIQETLNEAYKAFPWRFAQATATLTISSGIATLPTDFDIDHAFTTTWFSGTTELGLDEIDGRDKKLVSNGDNAVWMTSPTEDTYVLNTKDTTPTSLSVIYQKRAPVLDSTGIITTAYPRKMTLALGARRFVKLGQNPDADISQDQAIFEKQLNRDIAAQQIPAPRKARRSRQGQIGSTTGEF